MVEKCMYCGCELLNGSVLSVCQRCGEKVWGEKMFNTIVLNMENARENGDLCHTNNTCEFESKTNLNEEGSSFSL